MAKDNKKNIPVLRFPEFQNDGEWIAKSIKDIAKTFSGGTPTVGNSDYYGGSIPFIRSGEITKSTTDLFITELGLSSSSAKIVEEGTILYALYGATSGEVAISKIRGAINQAILAIIPKSRKYVVNYIYYFLKHQKAQILSKYLQGGQGNLSGAIIDNLSIAFPCDYKGNISDVEQTKIADCFVSIDKEIDATKRKLVLLKEHKKGLMQRLFPAKGKTTPELRFPEFQNDGEWEVYALGQIFSRITEKNTLNNQNVLTISAQYGLISQYDYFNKNVAALDVSKYYLVNKGDFAYNKSKSQGYPYGAIKALKLYNQGVVSPIYICFRIKDNQNFSKAFFEYYFESELIHKEINSISQEGARNHGLLNISTEDFFAKINLYVPSLTEQFKIANTLSSIDKQIAKYDEKIKALELHKQGLMQQLFPKL